jgi:two-component system chemotaxis response regulator CheY
MQFDCEFIAATSWGSMMKILVADDSGTMRKIIIRSLNAVGVSDIVEAADGNEAFDQFQREPVDAVLTDWNMPGRTGLELLKAIRAINKSIPVILITTEAEKTRVLEAVQAGVSDYLVKPFEAEALRAKLSKFVAIAT